MRLHEISDGVPIFISVEEHNFIKKHGSKVFVSSLDEHNSYLANNLVRKGVYSISNDRKVISKRDSNE